MYGLHCVRILNVGMCLRWGMIGRKGVFVWCDCLLSPLQSIVRVIPVCSSITTLIAMPTYRFQEYRQHSSRETVAYYTVVPFLVYLILI